MITQHVLCKMVIAALLIMPMKEQDIEKRIHRMLDYSNIRHLLREGAVAEAIDYLLTHGEIYEHRDWYFVMEEQHENKNIWWVGLRNCGGVH